MQTSAPMRAPLPYCSATVLTLLHATHRSTAMSARQSPADPSLVGQPAPAEPVSEGLSTGVAGGQKPTDLAASARSQMDAVQQDPQARASALSAFSPPRRTPPLRKAPAAPAASAAGHAECRAGHPEGGARASVASCKLAQAAVVANRVCFIAPCRRASPASRSAPRRQARTPRKWRA